MMFLFNVVTIVLMLPFLLDRARASGVCQGAGPPSCESLFGVTCTTCEDQCSSELEDCNGRCFFSIGCQCEFGACLPDQTQEVKCVPWDDEIFGCDAVTSEFDCEGVGCTWISDDDGFVVNPSLTPAPAPSPSPECVSSETTVQIQGRGSVKMADLEQGDVVMVQGGSFEPMCAFGHHNPTFLSRFIQLHTSDSNIPPLEVTEHHLVFLEDKNEPVPARVVKKGDVLRLSKEGFHPHNFHVTKIMKIERYGVCAPLTPSGTVVVNQGVVASTHVSLMWESSTEEEHIPGTRLSHHDFAHVALSPFHVICIGISPKLSTNQCNTDEGIPYLVSIGMELCNWAFNSFKEGNGFVIMALHVIVALAWVLKIVECVLRPLPLCMLLAAYIGFLHPPPSEMQNFVQGALIFTLQCTHALHLRAYDAPQAESGATIGRKVHRQQVLAHFMFACFIEYSMKNDQQVESTKKKLH